MKKLLLITSLFFIYLGSNAQSLWFSQSSNFTDLSSGVRNICAVDSNVVWMTAYDGSGVGLPRQDYSRTVDGGATWVANTIPTSAVWDCAMINAVDANNAIKRMKRYFKTNFAKCCHIGYYRFIS